MLPPRATRTGTISIHAPPRGATRALRVLLPHRADFNSRPSARGDMMIVKELQDEIVFQFTPLREGRRAFPPLVRR